MATLKKKIYEKKFKRYNSLFLDFFNKWTDDGNLYPNNISKPKNKNKHNNYTDINTTYYDSSRKKGYMNINLDINNFNMKERYAGLHYDENEIFNTNYEQFILNKINYIKKNKIKNYVTYIESSFDDFNGKEIQLKLESMKIKLYPINNKESLNKSNDNEDNNILQIHLPLSFVFLFYYEDMDFFYKILMSLLNFEKDFKTIVFDDEELYNTIKTIKMNDKNEKKDKKEEKEEKDEKEIDHLATFKSKKSIFENNSFKYNNKFLDKKDISDKEHRKSFYKHKLYFNKTSEKINKNDNRSIKVMHSDSNFKRNKKLYRSEEKKNITNSRFKENDINQKDAFYNEYYFIWETPKISYRVKIEMPKIFFVYENTDYNIITYCDKNLFLYLYKNNFINWDFYVLNYIFSIKAFRTIILQFLSLFKEGKKQSDNNKKKLMNLKKNAKGNKIETMFYYLMKDEETKNKKSRKNLFIGTRKAYNQMNENNESYAFFYSDSKFNNYILLFYSYHIKIEYDKLNPKLKWEFFLNFKQMRYLNEVSKYEQLSSFLPKIITTNFEYGKLNINFSVFDDNFNAKILETEDNKLSDNKKNSDIIIEIDKPYVEMEKIIDAKKKIKQELNYIFLQNINKLKMINWSKKILGIIDSKYIYDTGEYNKVELFKSKYFINNANKIDNSKVKNNVNRSNRQKLTYVSKGKEDEFMLRAFKKMKSFED